MSNSGEYIEEAGTVDHFSESRVECGPVRSYELVESELTVEFASARLWVRFYKAGAIRMTYAVRADYKHRTSPPDYSYAADGRLEPAAAELTEAQGHFTVSYEGFHLAVDKSDGRVSLKDDEGNTRFMDTGPFHWNERFCGVRRRLALRDRAYGLGEKTGTLEKRGRTYRMWNSDEPTHNPTRDPLYQSIPLLYLCDDVGATATFVDCTDSSWFDIGDMHNDQYTITVRDHLFDSYIFPAPTIGEALAQYVALTGRMSLPPIWALGYHQSRYSYYPDEQVRTIAREFRKRSIPCDVIHLDIHYMNGCRVFTWDADRFPDPKGLMEELREEGFRTVTIIDPGVKADPGYEVYDAGCEMDIFCRTANGERYIGRVWPGEAVFPDFTTAGARAFWADRVAGVLADGVSGIWNDMNEPADFTGDPNHRADFTPPSEVVAKGDGRPRSLDHYHNAYGQLMCRATVDGYERHDESERPFVLTRAGYAGIQRYAAVWTGDNHSWWEHLQMAIPMYANLGLSGVPFVGGDVGGFQLNATPELYARWMQLGSVTPFFRAHSQLGSKSHEPWSFGATVEEICRAYIELRYTLLPYIYSLVADSAESGRPIFRPLYWSYHDDERTWNLGDEFLFGPSLLAAPVLQPGKRSRSVYLPEGTWVDFRNGRLHRGPTDVLATAPLEWMPIYLRGPGIIPRGPVVQHTESGAFPELTVELIPGAFGESASFDLYEDDGHSTEYKRGAYSLTRLTLYTSDDGTIELTVERRESGYELSRKQLTLRIWAVSQAASVRRQSAAGSEVELEDGDVERQPGLGAIRFTVPADVSRVTVRDEEGRLPSGSPPR